MNSEFEDSAFLPRLPDDRKVVTLAEAASQALQHPGLTRFVGSEGSGPALISHALAAQSTRQIVYIAATSEVAQQAASDLTALGRGLPLARVPRCELGPPLVLAPSESTPYADVHS